jgi:hypothetical protein
LGKIQPKLDDLGNSMAKKAAGTNYGTGGDDEAQPTPDELGQAQPKPDDLVKCTAKQYAINGEMDGDDEAQPTPNELGKAQPKPNDLGKFMAKKAVITREMGGGDEAQPKPDELGKAQPKPDELANGMAKKAVVTVEMGGAFPKITVAIGKPKYHRRCDSGPVETGKRRWTKKSVIPSAAVANRKVAKATGNLKDDRNYESGPVPTAAVEIRMYESDYENLTWKQQEAAQSLPKGIYVKNIISKIRLL